MDDPTSCLVSCQMLDPQEVKTIRKADNAMPLQIADKVVSCVCDAHVWVNDLQMYVVAFVLGTDVPPLLCVGKLSKTRYALHQIDEDNSYLEKRSTGEVYICTQVHEVLLVCPATAAQEYVPRTNSASGSTLETGSDLTLELRAGSDLMLVSSAGSDLVLKADSPEEFVFQNHMV